LTCLDGCRTGNCADQRFGCQFFFGTRRGAHGRYSGRLSGEYSAWLDLKNMSMAGCRSVRRWLNGFVTKWCESSTSSHRFCAFCLEECDQNCGSEPARESGFSVDRDVECEAAFASRLAPTLVSRSPKSHVNPSP
jgi:hypothetical protein